MKQGTFVNEIFIHSTLEQALAVVSDFSANHHVHPLIEKVEVAEPTPPGVLKRYFIVDRLQWGPFRFKIKYRADVIALTGNSVHSEAYQSPGTYVTNRTSILPADGGVTLREDVTLKAPDLLFGYAFQQAESSHREMLQRIKSYLERAN